MSPDKTVLLVVDVQLDFCPGGSLAVPGGDDVVPVINRLSRDFRRIVATQDWHPPNHVSFASNHAGKKPFDTIPMRDGQQILWPDHCVPGTSGAEFHPDLDTLPFDLIVRKGTDPGLDSYSAFFENDRKTPTGLHFYLEGFKVKNVYIAGLALDFCVYYSAMDALKLGFQTTIVEDACRGIDSPAGSLNARLEELRKAGIRILNAANVEGS
ncbi:MAG: bifunctional nicotinamidase/pyrazinamidase [Spirochaetaceae bacterium]|nr:MAG: bifunctional nicotinamidase/pyrazinamidase [Spirochaetaceae bacterium]